MATDRIVRTELEFGALLHVPEGVRQANEQRGGLASLALPHPGEVGGLGVSVPGRGGTDALLGLQARMKGRREGHS